jgi:hypothetical protein
MSNAHANTASQSSQNHADRSRSQWPIDHVPPPILDLIVDTLANIAQRELQDISPRSSSYGKSTKFNLPFARVPFSPDLQAMSLTNKEFRANVLSRKIFPHVVLKSVSDCSRLNRVMATTTREYVR